MAGGLSALALAIVVSTSTIPTSTGTPDLERVLKSRNLWIERAGIERAKKRACFKDLAAADKVIAAAPGAWPVDRGPSAGALAGWFAAIFAAGFTIAALAL